MKSVQKINDEKSNDKTVDLFFRFSGNYPQVRLLLHRNNLQSDKVNRDYPKFSNQWEEGNPNLIFRPKICHPKGMI